MPGRRFSGPLVPGTTSVRQVNRRPARKKVSTLPFRATKAITTIVDKQIHKNIENKDIAKVQVPTQINAVMGTTQQENIFRFFPRVARGTDKHSRIGDKITPRFCQIKGYITLDLNDVSEQDYDRVAVRIIAGFPKRYPLAGEALDDITNEPLANWTNTLMNYGTVMGAYDGTLRAIQAPVNRKEFTVKGQRTLFLSRPRFYDAPLVGSDAFRNSGNSVKFFSMKIKCPKTINYYDENDSTNSTTFEPILLAGYSLLNGATPAAPGPSAPKPVSISFTTRLIYEDA